MSLLQNVSVSNKYLLISIIQVSLFLGCSKGSFETNFSQSSLVGSSSISANVDNQYKQQALAIIQNKCSSCHTTLSGPSGVLNLTDPVHLLNSGLIIPGQANASPLFSAMNSTMPPSGSLSSSDLLVINNWIMGMETSPPISTCNFNGQSLQSGGSVKAYSTTTVPAGQTCLSEVRVCNAGALSGSYAFSSCTVTAAIAPTFQSLSADIFQPKCVGCHKAGSAAGGYAYDTYASVLKSVNVTTPTSSLVYTDTLKGSMPKGGARLTTSELSQLLMWIQAGALNN